MILTKVLKTSIVIIVLLIAGMSQTVFAQEDGWISLFDGQSLDGWTASENTASIRVEDGTITTDGPRSHLFYTGPVEDADFKNFEFRAEVMITPGSNSGIYFHTAYQEQGWPAQGYEVQVHNTHVGPEEGYVERKLTGSLYAVRNVYKALAPDNEWFTMHITVMANHVMIRVNDMLVVDYVQPDNPVRTESYQGRVLSSGTFAIQGHDPDSRAYYRNIEVKPLPDDLPRDVTQYPVLDETARRIYELSSGNFPLIDLHMHAKEGLSMDEALSKSHRVGIMYGVAPNCGLGFPITDDQGIYDYIEEMSDQPVFVGMQAEGREWVDLFTPEAISQFDYVFSDALTFFDDDGNRTQLWIPETVHFDDPQEFMDMYIDRIVSVMNEPIDIFVNPTFLPTRILDQYDELWTEERMQTMIDAAVENDVAIEINDRYQIPSATFIKQAKASGAKFSLGTNNGDANYGNLDYSLRMIEECELNAADMFIPKPDGEKAIQVKEFPGE